MEIYTVHKYTKQPIYQTSVIMENLHIVAETKQLNLWL